MDEQFLNRRIAERIQLDLPCEVQCAGKTYEGRVLNLSLTGVKVLCPSLTAGSGTLLDLKVLTESGTIELAGKVARKPGPGDPYGIRLRGDTRELNAALSPLLRATRRKR